MADFPVLIEDLTPAWLGRVLGAEVGAVRSEPVGTGQIGTCYRLFLTGDDVPDRIVAKLPARDPETRAAVAPSYLTEGHFYRDLAPSLRIRVPHCHHVEIAEGGDFVLLLEDLAPAEQGDQIAGCTATQAADALANLAGLHGPRWNDATLQELTFLAPLGGDQLAGLSMVFEPSVDQFVTAMDGRLGAADVAVLRAIPAKLEAWFAARSERVGLLHSDYRLDNILFHPEATTGSVAVDWQTLTTGLPARDLAYFVGTGLDPHVRREAERDLVATYHAALPEQVRAGYDLDTCFDDYAFGMVQVALVGVLGKVYGQVSERGDDMFAAMMTRGCAAMRDLETLDRIS